MHARNIVYGRNGREVFETKNNETAEGVGRVVRPWSDRENK